jgi:DNA-binding CsgD family transcriptional regulator
MNTVTLSQLPSGALDSARDRATLPPAALRLTEREREIAQLVGMGLTNPEIGAVLSLSPLSVKSHLQRIRRRLGVSRRMDIAVLTGFVSGVRQQLPPLRRPLTMRERQVLDLLAQSKSNQQIAAALGLAVGTVKVHLRQINWVMRNPGKGTRVAVVRLAVGYGLVDVGAGVAPWPLTTSERDRLDRLPYDMSRVDIRRIVEVASATPAVRLIVVRAAPRGAPTGQSWRMVWLMADGTTGRAFSLAEQKGVSQGTGMHVCIAVEALRRGLVR